MGKRRKSSSDSSSDDNSNESPVEKNNSSSSSSSEDDDEDWNQRGSRMKKTKKGRPVKKVARHETPTRAADSDADEPEPKSDEEEEKEEGEVDEDDDDQDEEEFNDGYDENLLGDEEDQQRLASMTEKEREQELFNRSEKREVLRTRFEIEKKLRLAKRKEQCISSKQSLTEASVRSTTRRKALDDNKKVKDAIRGLKEQREKRRQKQQRLRASDVYSSDSSSSDDDNDKKAKSSSSSSSSSGSSSDSEYESRRRGSDDEKSKVKEEEYIFDLKELNSVRLSRHKFSQWCHAPFFRDTIVGCFARISLAPAGDGLPRYSAFEIVDVSEGTRKYTLENTETNKVIKVRAGRDERSFRLEFTSNSEFTQEDLDELQMRIHRDRMYLPTRDHIERKKRDIQNAINYEYKENDIEHIVREKEKFKESSLNFAMKKTKLMKQKEMTEQLGDHLEVERINQRIDEFEERAKKLDLKRTRNISAISYINKRNRLKNIIEAEKAIMEDREKENANQMDDPFRRRKCAPTLVHKIQQA